MTIKLKTDYLCDPTLGLMYLFFMINDYLSIYRMQTNNFAKKHVECHFSIT